LYVSVPKINPETGAWLPCQFPASVPTTPPIELACSPALDKDQDGRFDENPDIWRLPTWSALQFVITGQHHCAYSFQSKGTGAEATFEVMANCDMDCDTLTSTFIRYGKAVALRPEEGASARDCTCEQAVAPYVERESE